MRTKREYLYYAWKKVGEIQMRKRYNKEHFKEDIERYYACHYKKPLSQMQKELGVLRKYWNCFPYQYYRYDMYRLDCELDVHAMLAYVPHYFLTNLFYPVSTKNYGMICHDKRLTAALLSAYHINQPSYLLSFEDGKFYNDTNEEITADDVDLLISTKNVAKLFVKPVFGLGGKGIIAFKKTASGLFLDKSDRALTAALLIEQYKKLPYIIQEGVVQHEELSALHPASVNTFRVFTECVKGEARLLFSIVRMGRDGNDVDNASCGGVYIKIDPTTGELYEYAINKNRDKFYAHPTTGFVFKGTTITVWDTVRNFALQAAKKFKEIKHIGWDIAMTADGPLVIEMNNEPDEAVIQDFYGGIRDELKITPNDYWYIAKFGMKTM